MSASPNAIEVDGVWKLYTRDAAEAKRSAPAASGDGPGPGRFWALRDVTFNVRRGEVVGLIGANGAGKSTLLKIMSRITAPTRGQVRVNGSIVSLLEVGTGFHEELSGRENIKLNATILGMSPDDLTNRFDDIVSFSGIEQFLDMPVKHLSSGMRVRLGFSIAVHVAPDILIVDEILAVGDAEFQDKCRRKVAELVQEHDRTVLIVSHSMGSIDGLCSRAVMLEEGRVIREGDPSDVIDAYLAASGEKRKALADPEVVRREAEKAALKEQRAVEKAAKLAAAAERDSLKRQAAERVALMDPIKIDDGAWNLKARIDRSGSGRLLFERLAIRGENGLPEIHAGAPVRFELTYSAAEDAIGRRQASFSVVIADEKNEPIFWLPSNNAYGSVVELTRRGEIVCDVPSLPLLPGAYSVRVWAQLEGERTDRIHNAARLTVLPAPFFPTGTMQKTSNGNVLVAHAWSFAPKEDEPVRTEGAAAADS